MYQRMLVPLDGSTLAEVVFPYARDLAGRLDIDITLLHVSAPELSQFAPMRFAPMRRAYIEQATKTLEEQARKIQKETGAHPETRPIEVQGELAGGYPAEEILHYAEQNSIDLILMAAHGQSGVKRWAIGSVAGKVAGATAIPVWLIKPTPSEETPYDEWPNKTLIVPLDGSELAESVLTHVEVLAKQRGSVPVHVVLLRVNEPMTIPAYYSPDISGASLDWGSFIQQNAVRRRETAKEYLAEIEKRLERSSISVKSVLIEGKPNDEIVDYANKLPFSMIIMATHGRSGLSRLVYGSAAANILQGVSRPMFIIKPR
jgi:nucleotide-binding universal stress UspA family protein